MFGQKSRTQDLGGGQCRRKTLGCDSNPSAALSGPDNESLQLCWRMVTSRLSGAVGVTPVSPVPCSGRSLAAMYSRR